ncbi:MAG: NlpC/P60 family protein [Chthonomonadales bacterium]
MRSHLLRWALTSVAATCLALGAQAGPRTVTIGPGMSLDSLARKYHVSVKDIARANHISVNALLIDGHRLVIPDPPKPVRRPTTMHLRAWINGDRVSIRLGPSEQSRRVTLLDHGAPLTATARAGDWVQVKLAGGSVGWVKGDFLKISGSAARVAREKAPHRMASDVARRRLRSAQHAKKERLARLHRRAIARMHHAPRVASSHRRHEHRRVAARVSPGTSDIVRTAFAYRGTPYHYGGSGRRGFDCSGFTRYVYARKGIVLPHSAEEQFHVGRKVPAGHLRQGDLVFFHTTRRGISHVGIYVGNGKFVHASSAGGSVRVDSLSSGYYRERFRGARRVR